MHYYVLQVVTGTENSVKEALLSFNIINPQRKLLIRKMGKEVSEVKPIFPGYLFLKAEILDTKTIQILKTTPNVVRLLNNYSNPTPLTKTDLEVLKPILNPNFKPEISDIKYDINDKIVVINGPLKEFEGKISKVDRRKKRAIVEVEMYSKIFKISFSFVDISK